MPIWFLLVEKYGRDDTFYSVNCWYNLQIQKGPGSRFRDNSMFSDWIIRICKEAIVFDANGSLKKSTHHIYVHL